jgi:hypothetical protein
MRKIKEGIVELSATKCVNLDTGMPQVGPCRLVQNWLAVVGVVKMNAARVESL